MEEKYNFKLSADEFEFLHRLATNDEMLADLLRHHQGTVERFTLVLCLSWTAAEELRERLTIHLAEIGFDEEYLPNEQGRRLENLIDKFYIPERT